MKRLAVVCISLTAALGFAQAPGTIHFNARLGDSSGAPLSGARSLTFRLFDAPTGGAASWTETHSVTFTNDGLASVELGSTTPFTPSHFSGTRRFLEVQVDTSTLSPRLTVTSVPYALRAEVAGLLGSLAEADVQRRVTGTCASGEAMTAVGASGTVTCAPISSLSLAGTGTATTAARSDHTHAASDLLAGTVRLANTTAPCNTAAEGTVRWSGSSMDLCNGTTWQSITVAGDGTTAARAARSCKEIKHNNPLATSGSYFIDPDLGATSNAFSVYCDMTTAGGGWTLMAVNRHDAHVTAFYQTWAVYKAGFGDVTTNTSMAGWIGNDNIHLLTRDGSATLRVVTNNRTYTYVGFHIGDEASRYRAYVPNSDYNAGNAASGLRYAHGMRFSAYDQDNDNWTGNCANDRHSGWWYNQCWYTQFADQVANQSYWNEPETPADNFTTIELYLR